MEIYSETFGETKTVHYNKVALFWRHFVVISKVTLTVVGVYIQSNLKYKENKVGYDKDSYYQFKLHETVKILANKQI